MSESVTGTTARGRRELLRPSMACNAVAIAALNIVAAQGAAADWQLGPPQRYAGLINSYPTQSPDGKRVLFQSNRSGRWELYVMNVDGSGLVQLTNAPGDNVTPSWSPQGDRIAFAASPADGDSEIFVINADGSGRRAVAPARGDDSHPHWSPDGTRIIFNSARTTPDLAADWSKQWHEVFSVRGDGTDLRQHTHCRTVCTYPSYSPDGTRIAYRKVLDAPGFQWNLASGSRNSEVFVARLDGTQETNVSQSAAFDGWPAWAPDARMLVFASNRAGPASVGQLCLVAADGTGLRQLTHGPRSYSQPSWSANGRWVYAYEQEETADYEAGNIVALPVVD